MLLPDIVPGLSSAEVIYSIYNVIVLGVNHDRVPIDLISVYFGRPPSPQLAILGGRKNEKGAPIPHRILKVGGKKRI